ncbi:hypothetical protein BX070DRAFT_230273 [Coemansia spiralis]|nr:hypothetical protein BX070DRAFT_230273 [Coemansia spiralis]
MPNRLLPIPICHNCVAVFPYGYGEHAPRCINNPKWREWNYSKSLFHKVAGCCPKTCLKTEY